MAQRLFRYEVGYYNEYLDQECVDKGILTAGSYVNAVQRLCRPGDGYGPDLTYIKVQDMADSIMTDSDLECSKQIFEKCK